MYTIEEESGTLSGSPRQHNGYYAGDFSQASQPRTRSHADHTVYAPTAVR